MKLILPTLSTLILMSFFASCEKSADNDTSSNTGKLTVQATNYPNFYFASRIAGDLIDLQLRVPGDIDPAFWKPTDEDLAALQAADLILMNGATYEKWAETVSLPTNTQIKTSKPFSNAYVTEKGGITHSHGDGTVHSHDGIAFTTWLNLEYAKQQAEAIRDALAKRLPEAEDRIYLKTADLTSELDELDKALKEASENIGKTPLLTSHPVYQYLARRYQLNIAAVHWEPETVPDEAAMKELKSKTSNHPAKYMIWEGQPVAESVAKLEALGIESIVFAPCGNRPDSEDFISVMKANIEALKTIH